MSKINIKAVYIRKDANLGEGDLRETTVPMDSHDWNFKGHVEQAIAAKEGTSYFNITARSWKRA